LRWPTRFMDSNSNRFLGFLIGAVDLGRQAGVDAVVGVLFGGEPAIALLQLNWVNAILRSMHPKISSQVFRPLGVGRAAKPVVFTHLPTLLASRIEELLPHRWIPAAGR